MYKTAIPTHTSRKESLTEQEIIATRAQLAVSLYNTGTSGLDQGPAILAVMDALRKGDARPDRRITGRAPAARGRAWSRATVRFAHERVPEAEFTETAQGVVARASGADAWPPLDLACKPIDLVLDQHDNAAGRL